MKSVIQRFYWKLPYFAKTLMASWYAMKRDRERYGCEFDEIIKELDSHNDWSRERYEQYQLEKLRATLTCAAVKVPYYRKMFAERNVNPRDFQSFSDIRKLPILEKTSMRANPELFLNEEFDKSKLIMNQTSGTTGTPLKIYRDIYANSAAFAFVDRRCYAIAGVRKRYNRSVTFASHLVAAPDRDKPPFWVHNRHWNQLYMSSYHLSPKYLGFYVDELRRFKADFIEGYPSSLYSVANYMLTEGLEPLSFKACFSTSETLFQYQRQAIEKAFGCKVFNQYGCGEEVVFASECAMGNIHLSPEMGYLEVVDENDQPVEPGKTGQFICTGFVNTVQVFIRYRLGDMGAISGMVCRCGSPLPVLEEIEGRIDEVLITRDGRRIGRLGTVFKDASGISEAQIVQDDYDKFRIRVVPASGYTTATANTIIKNLSNRVGGGHIEVELVERIERTSSGKFKVIVCRIGR